MKSFTYADKDTSVALIVDAGYVSVAGTSTKASINGRIKRNVRKFKVSDIAHAACKSVVLGLVKSINRDYGARLALQKAEQMVVFIPHSVMSEGLCFKQTAILERIKKETGASAAEYHKAHASNCVCGSHHPYTDMAGVYHIVLTNPTMSMAEIKDKYANGFARDMPVWYWDI